MMTSKMLMAALAALALGCGSDENADKSPFDVAHIPWQTVDGKGDLPNGSVYEREHDSSGYRAIADDFAERGFDTTIDLSQLQAVWPMREDATAVMNRFGTPILLGSSGYMHTAFDVYRDDTASSDEVLAPVSGIARVYDWWGTPGYQGRPYSGVVAIWDPQSHLIVQLMHVEPTRELQDVDELEVQAGDVIGRLADDLTWLAPEHLERYRHTHVDFIDGEGQLALNPATALPYEDVVAPVLHSAYLLDSAAQRTEQLGSGQYDIVLELSDRDDTDSRNFEVGSIAYEITDDAGNVVAKSERCMFSDFIDRLDHENLPSARDPSPRYIDFGNARHQMEDNSWPSSDLGDVNRTFRYALTQFGVNDEGRCETRFDAEGFVDVTDAVGSLRVVATVWDQNDNVLEVEHVFDRSEPQPEGGLVINEILADPPRDYDANGDGTASVRGDEFVEIVNSGTTAVNLSGYALSDDQATRHVFGDVTLEPGAVLVVFADETAAMSGAHVVSAGMLGLNNDGDTVRLVNADGEVVDEVTYGREAGNDASLVREVEGDITSAFVAHPNHPASPGTRADGSRF